MKAQRGTAGSPAQYSDGAPSSVMVCQRPILLRHPDTAPTIAPFTATTAARSMYEGGKTFSDLCQALVHICLQIVDTQGSVLHLLRQTTPGIFELLPEASSDFVDLLLQRLLPLF